MTSGPHTLASTTGSASRPSRLTVKPKAPTTGFVDGAWWPQSTDLATELPAFLAGLAGRLGIVERLTYNLDTWDPVARRVTVEGREVRLDGFHSQHAGTIGVIASGGQARLTLLVIPPETAAAAAKRVMKTASQPENGDSVAVLLGL